MEKKKSVKKGSVKKKSSKKKTSIKKNSKPNTTIAIIALLLNILIIPGLGTIVGGKTKIGIWQIVLSIIGVILSVILIGIPILIAAWIWGIVTGIKLIQESSQ